MAIGPQFDHNTVFEIDGHKVKIAPGLNDLKITGMGDGLHIEAEWRRTYSSVQEAIEGGALVAVYEAVPDQQIPPGGGTVQWQE